MSLGTNLNTKILGLSRKLMRMRGALSKEAKLD